LKKKNFLVNFFLKNLSIPNKKNARIKSTKINKNKIAIKNLNTKKNKKMSSNIRKLN